MFVVENLDFTSGSCKQNLELGRGSPCIWGMSKKEPKVQLCSAGHGTFCHWWGGFPDIWDDKNWPRTLGAPQYAWGKINGWHQLKEPGEPFPHMAPVQAVCFRTKMGLFENSYPHSIHCLIIMSRILNLPGVYPMFRPKYHIVMFIIIFTKCIPVYIYIFFVGVYVYRNVYCIYTYYIH